MVVLPIGQCLVNIFNKEKFSTRKTFGNSENTLLVPLLAFKGTFRASISIGHKITHTVWLNER